MGLICPNCGTTKGRFIGISYKGMFLCRKCNIQNPQLLSQIIVKARIGGEI